MRSRLACVALLVWLVVVGAACGRSSSAAPTGRPWTCLDNGREVHCVENAAKCEVMRAFHEEFGNRGRVCKPSPGPKYCFATFRPATSWTCLADRATCEQVKAREPSAETPCAEYPVPATEYESPGRGWHCFDADFGSGRKAGTCDRHAGACEKLRAQVPPAAVTTPCKAQPEAACAVLWDPRTKEAFVNCGSTLEQCEDQAAMLDENERLELHVACAMWK